MNSRRERWEEEVRPFGGGKVRGGVGGGGPQWRKRAGEKDKTQGDFTPAKIGEKRRSGVGVMGGPP